MEYATEHRSSNNGQGDTLIIKLMGRITHADHGTFRSFIDTMTRQPFVRVVMDLGNAEFIDSAGLGMLLLMRDAADKVKTLIILKQAKGQVLRLIETSRFNSLFTLEN